MDELKIKIDEIVNEFITPKFIKRLCGFSYFFNQNQTNLYT